MVIYASLHLNSELSTYSAYGTLSPNFRGFFYSIISNLFSIHSGIGIGIHFVTYFGIGFGWYWYSFSFCCVNGALVLGWVTPYPSAARSCIRAFVGLNGSLNRGIGHTLAQKRASKLFVDGPIV